MAAFTWELTFAVVVTLFALSQARQPHQCDPYTDDIFGPQAGRKCPFSDSDTHQNKTYCCQTITGDRIEERCCTKGEYLKEASSLDTIAVIGLSIGGAIVLSVIAVVIRICIYRNRRARIHRETRAVAQAVVIAGHAPPCYEHPAKVGQYRQFQNPPTYPIN